MSHKQSYAIPAAFARNAYLNTEQYKALYHRSIVDPASFWAEQAKQFVTWFEPWQQTTQGDFTNLDLHWFKGGKLNVSYNCLDRHLTNYAEQIAIIWEGDESNQTRTITYQQLHTEVCRFANVLKKYGIKKGDRVCIYLPMIPEIAVAMLACVRIGAIHSVVFAGFSAASLKTRILDADCRLLITADEGVRSGKPILLKNNADAALADCPNVKQVIVVKRTGNEINWQRNRDVWYHEVMEESSAECHAEMMDAEDPLFILYTSGSTGKPKGILHATGGYLVYAAMSFHYTFDYRAPDVFWCTADLGWITGHSYLLYGPLANHATTLMFEGAPHYPNFSRLWNIIDKHQVNIFYTAPTAIRALRKEGDEWVTATQRTSLKLLGTVGEPINSEVWEWYYHVVGEERCPIVDTWWQTETGGMLITPLPGVTPLKPGSPSWPFFGIVPEVVDDDGNKLPPNTQGNLVIKQPWPGLMSTIYKDQERFINNYFKPIPGNYFTGDSAYYDEDGYFWIVGRNDDVIKISGHRIGTGEVESAIVSHPAVAEAAVVGIPDDIKGQTIYAFVTPNANISPNDQLTQEVIQQVRNVIGAIATPKFIQWTNALPKTRSGKIMRRILRKIACSDLEDFGDTSTLLDPGVIEELIRGKK